MKIMHIIAGAERGGAETFCADAIKALHDAGITQEVICRPHPDFVAMLDARGIKHTPLSFNRFGKWCAQRKIRRAVTAFAPDLVHAWMSRASSFVPAGLGVPVLGWFGGYYDLKNYKNCTHYMGVTRDIGRHIAAQSGKPDHCFVVHTFGTLEPDAPITRESLGVPPGAKTVLLLSRMHWKKGVDTLLLAAAQSTGLYFLLAGDGPDLEKYKKMAQDMGVTGRVNFLGWRTDRAALLGVADVCVLPSRYEPFGTVIAEAWFAGVPLVAAKAAGASQYVTHEQDGLLHDIDDHNTLARQIAAAAHDENLRAHLIANGQNTYQSLFSREVVTQDLLAAYKKITDTAA